MAEPTRNEVALLEAIALQDANAALALIAAGCSGNARDPETGRSALTMAVRPGMEEVAARLIEAGCGQEVMDEAVLYAAGRGNGTILRSLLDHGANPDGPNPKYPALAVAAARKRAELVPILLAAGCSQVALDQAVGFAVQAGQHEVLALLLQHGANANVMFAGPPLLHWAVLRSDRTSVRLLLDAGADPNLRGQGIGQSTLLLAVIRRDQELVTLLLTYGANPDGEEESGLTVREAARLSGINLDASR